MTFGEKLIKLRKEKGLSQEKLAERLGVSRQAISKWELNESKPDTDNIVEISLVFDVSIDYLLKDSEEIKSSTVDACDNQNASTGQILFIAASAFLAIGLFSSFGGWYSEQTSDVIWGGMIVQVVGIAGYFIGKMLIKREVSFAQAILNLALILFMPVSMIVSLLLDMPISPYPIGIAAIATFIVIYIMLLVALTLCLKRKLFNTKKAE